MYIFVGYSYRLLLSNVFWLRITLTLILIFLFLFSLMRRAQSLEIVSPVTLNFQIEGSPIKKTTTIRKVVIYTIFLRTSTKQAYHCRYMNSRSKHNVSYVVAFEVLRKLIRNQNNAVGMWLNYGLVPLGSTTSHGFQQEIFYFFLLHWSPHRILSPNLLPYNG